MSNHRCSFPTLVALLIAALAAVAAAGEPKEAKEPKFALKGHEVAIRSLSFSPDGKMLVSRGDDGVVWLWDLVEGKANRMLGKTAEKAAAAIVAFAPGNKKVVVADGKLDRMEVWDIEPGKATIESQKPKLSKFYLDFAASRVPMEMNDDYLNGVVPILFSPDGKLVVRPAVGPGGKHVKLDTPVTRRVRRVFFHVWELASGEPAAEDASHAKWLRAAFSKLLTSDPIRLHGMQYAKGGGIRAVSADHEILASPVQGTFKSGNIGPSISVFEVESEKLLASLPLDTKSPTRAVAVSADGRLVAAGGDDMMVRVWEVPGWKRKEAKKPCKKDYMEADLGGGVKMKLVRIEPGKFIMGSPKSEQYYVCNQWPPLGKEGKGWVAREKQHEVEITKPYYMGIYTVTQAQYEKLIGKNPSAFSAASGNKQVAKLDTASFPVESLSWDDAMEFCKKLSKKEGKTFDLPTEAEWEYACRAGTTTPFHCGKILTFDEANFDSKFPYGVKEEIPSLGRTTAVGSYEPNPWGLYDMHGNVNQWCKDWYGPYPNGPVQDPQGKEEKGSTKGWTRIVRGGCWQSAARASRSAYYYDALPNERSSSNGFRVVLRVP